MEWLKAGLGPLEKLISFLQKKAVTNDVQKKTGFTGTSTEPECF